MRDSAGKVVPLDVLVKRLGVERSARRRIVFTNGCFDLLHVGHLHLLESAARLGDVLVVGINRDPSVSDLKGAERPILPFEERARLVAGLETVDWVVGFDEPTPLELIEAVAPDVLAKGGDWPVEEIVGREIVDRRGGRVVSIPLQLGRSTSRLLRRIRG